MARNIPFDLVRSSGTVMLFVGLTQYVPQHRNLAHDVRVDATLVRSAVFGTTSKDPDSRVAGSNNMTTHRPDVRFRHRVAEAEFESDVRPAVEDSAVHRPRELFGAWRVTTAVIAPWVESDRAAVPRTTYLSNLVHIDALSFRGLGRFACTSPRYESTREPPEGLFQGNLPSPAAPAARSLGFTTGTVRGLRISCATGVFEFHMLDAMHLLVAIDNVIWTLDRSPAALAVPAPPKDRPHDHSGTYAEHEQVPAALLTHHQSTP